MENLSCSKCVCDEIDLQLKPKKISKNLWRLAYPTMISAGLQNFYDIVDMVWVGQISKTALSGVTLFSSIYLLFTILNEVAGASSVSMISQNYGRGDMEKTQRIAEQTISFKVVLAVISGSLLALFLKPILWFFLPDQEVLNSALEYGWLRIFFIPVMFSSYSVNTIFRCTGDAKTPLHIMIISTIINLVLDPVFMFDIIPGTNIPGLGMGVFGAALATVTARSISFLYGFLILLSGRRKVKISFKGLFRLDKKIDTDLLLIGLPSGINSLVRSFAQVTIMKFVTVYGADAVALAGVGGKLSQFAFMPIFGFNMGGATLVGQSLGRDNVKEAKLTSKINAFMSASVVGIFAVIIMGTPQTFLRFFFPNDPSMLLQGSLMLRIFYPSFIILSMGLGLAVVFSGSGHTRPILYSTLGSRWFVQIPFLFLVVNILHLPLFAVWTSYIFSEAAEFMVILYHYRKGAWCNKRV